MASLSYAVYSKNTTLAQHLENKNKMILISDELRQSSDDLTHFARTYVVTNDERHKQKYFTILNIRDGKAPRPFAYETIYWDLEQKIREQRHPLGKKSSLDNRIASLPFSEEEMALLKHAEDESNTLVNLELKAFELMFYKDEDKTSQDKAIAMLHSQEYYKAKHKIMDPIDQFILALNIRMNKEIKGAQHGVSLYIVLISLSTILLILINIYFYVYLKKKDKKFYRTQQRFKDLIDGTTTWVWEIDSNGEYTYSSHQVKDILGYEIAEVIGKTPFDLMSKEEASSMIGTFTDIVQNQKNIVELENVNIHKDGHEVYMLTNGAPYFDDKGKYLGYRGMDIDISERKSLELRLEGYSKSLEDEVRLRTQDLQYQAHHDALTELPNRVLFNDRLEHAIQNTKRTQTKVALLFLDLDHFKEINDSLGHDVGDIVLKEVTRRLHKIVRAEDSIARLGGDEFSIILEELSQAQDASFVAQKILDILAEPIIVEQDTLYISSSIGISIYPNDGDSTQNLLKFADSAMYKAKNEGRNNYQFYSSELTELAFERVIMETSLRDAIVNEEFVVYYQPQIDAKNSTIVGMEALVRWQHPRMGIVPPAKFIPLAESTGLIIDIDRFVMKTAMLQLSQWYTQGLNPGVLAMNLAMAQLQKSDFIEMLKEMLRETQCQAQWIELEVTEGQIMKDPEEAIKILQKISDLGVELAIDDFGTGYSSLAYLKKLPIDKLKIDQAFVRDLPEDEEDSAITRAVIALAKSLNIRVIAEGVETKEQKDFLVQNACNDIQGYFYSRPIPAQDFEIYLKSGYELSIME
ncbi:EAL domain-containing protein [Sulfurimonas sp.]|nr:EAL domain-containing protein [Sulfurimonas sp.]